MNWSMYLVFFIAFHALRFGKHFALATNIMQAIVHPNNKVLYGYLLFSKDPKNIHSELASTHSFNTNHQKT